MGLRGWAQRADSPPMGPRRALLPAGGAGPRRGRRSGAAESGMRSCAQRRRLTQLCREPVAPRRTACTGTRSCGCTSSPFLASVTSSSLSAAGGRRRGAPVRTERPPDCFRPFPSGAGLSLLLQHGTPVRHAVSPESRRGPRYRQAVLCGSFPGSARCC